MISLALGTKQFIQVQVMDNSPTPETDLSTRTPRYDVLKPDGVTLLVSNGTPTVSGMILFCNIDTTTLTNSDKGHYQLWVKFTLSPEAPKLGPIDFYLV